MIPSRNPKMVILVGPPGSGKSTYAKAYEDAGFVRVSQDDQGKQGHQDVFMIAGRNNDDIIVDRMNFNKQQRQNYLMHAKQNDYDTEVIVLHENYETCWNRMLKREDHPTIKNEENAKNALSTFFTKYERPEPGEADEIKFVYPSGDKPIAIWTDIDGTIANCEHRRHFVRREGKKDWLGFFKAMSEDTIIGPVMQVLDQFDGHYPIVYCTGRPSSYRKETETWLLRKNAPKGLLFMRPRNDSRQDDIVKEIILDFEVKTRFEILFCLDDRDQVVKMLRKRGLTVFQVAEGDF